MKENEITLSRTEHDIRYRINAPLAVDQFVDILHTSGLAERRPVDDRECMEGMLQHSNLVITAWNNGKIVGIARSVTDFNYACYLSDLAVHHDFQGYGIGKQLQAITQSQLGPHGKLILVAAPDANSYYDHIGFSHNSRCWILERDRKISL